MGRDERDDVAVKDILSHLAKDKTVLEEVRNIAIRGLSQGGRSNTANRHPEKLPSQEREVVERGNDSDAPRQKGRAERLFAQSKEYLAQILRQNGTKQQDTAKGSDEELTFDISKDSDTYRKIISTVKWHRDSFLIGSAFADQRSDEQQVSRKKGATIHGQTSGENVQLMGKQSPNQSAIPKSDPLTAMGHPILLSAGVSYIRSVAAVDLLRPYATWAVSKDGPMFQTASQLMAQTIPLGQNSCDWAMRENLLWVLKDEEWMEWAKSITTEYVDRSYKDD